VVGPEGGLSCDEARFLEDRGAVRASMGDLILRTESAGPHAAMLIRYHYGLLKPGGDARG
jgi:RsmE family RNA methyltransferase